MSVEIPDRLSLPCPAKINLFLHVLHRRSNGYHELQTVFQLLDHGDQLDLTCTHDGLIVLQSNLVGVAQEQNLAYRAAQLLQPHATGGLGIQMTLHKCLPIGGGVGGGSSNAATALLGLNCLWQCGLNIDQLADMGGALGADVPVFVRGYSAWAEGVGEILKPIKLPEKWFVVLAPNCHVSTAEIFSHEGLTRDSKRIKVRAFLEEGGKNDCQPLVESLYPQVKDAVDWLSQFGPAQMSGTGACVFASFGSELEARDVFAKRPKQLNGFVAKGVNQSPLHQRLRKQVSNWGVAKW